MSSKLSSVQFQSSCFAFDTIEVARPGLEPETLHISCYRPTGDGEIGPYATVSPFIRSFEVFPDKILLLFIISILEY
jgi:hypothetical protein